jgi:hypothetical protein
MKLQVQVCHRFGYHLGMLAARNHPNLETGIANRLVNQRCDFQAFWSRPGKTDQPQWCLWRVEHNYYWDMKVRILYQY